MKLLFKQRLLSWFDSYDIYNEEGETVFTVQGKLSWGHRLEIYDASERHLGTVKEELLTMMPRFALYSGDRCLGSIRKKLTFLKPLYTLDCNGWEVRGDILEWNYEVWDPASGRMVMTAHKEIWNWTDTYTIDVADDRDVLLSLMIVLAIDAAQCDRS